MLVGLPVALHTVPAARSWLIPPSQGIEPPGAVPDRDVQWTPGTTSTPRGSPLAKRGRAPLTCGDLPGSAGSASSPALPWEFLWRLLPPAIPFYGSWPVAS